jgi:FkbM family methyltransferase
MTDSSERFLSYSQNGEDVVLRRALASVTEGTYVDIGANHPTIDSVSRAFYNAGWSGLLAEPSPEYAAMLREERPRDVLAESVVSDRDGTVTLHMVQGSGLSTIVDEIGSAHAESGTEVVDVEVASIPLSDLLDREGFDGRPIHFLSIDTEGAELSVLRGIDFTRHRPWILVIEATAPNSTRQTHTAWEELVLAAGYEFCLFDGLSRFYVADEQRALAPLLSYPACVFDEFDTLTERELSERASARELEVAALTENLVRSEEALTANQDELVATREELHQVLAERDELRDEVANLREDYTAVRDTVSWRLTAPLRAVRRHKP